MRQDLDLERNRLVDRLIREGIVRNDEVSRTLRTIPRERFVWPDCEEQAYTDTPLPLGCTGQTISAPHMVAIMLEEADLMPGLKVLEIGAGSGYNAALIAEIVSPRGEDQSKGHVTTLECMQSLVEFATRNLNAIGYGDVVTVVFGDGTLGYPQRSDEELYDRIIVTAAAPHVPQFLKLQLVVGGVLLIPVGDRWSQSLIKAVKQKDRSLRTKHICDCVFVPLIGEDGYK